MSSKMLTWRTRLNSLLDALTMGVLQNLQVTANDRSVAIIPQALNTRITIPPALEYVKFTKGKSMHFVLASLDCFPFGHSMQRSDPGIGLIVPRRQGTHCQQHGEVMAFLVPAEHRSKHSDLGGLPFEVFQRILLKICNRVYMSCWSFSFHCPTTTFFSCLVLVFPLVVKLEYHRRPMACRQVCQNLFFPLVQQT